MSTFVDIPVKAFNTYQQMSLLRCEKIKYVQIVRKTIRGKKVYILQIVCQGFPSSKVTKGKENDQYQQAQLNQDFPVFYRQMKDFLQQTPKTKRLAWYLN